MDCLCSTHIFLYSSVWENGTCLFFRIPYTAIWIFRVTLGNYPLHVIYAIPLKVFGFTLFEITHIYNTKVMLYNIDTHSRTYKNYVAIKDGNPWWLFFFNFLNLKTLVYSLIITYKRNVVNTDLTAFLLYLFLLTT